MRFRREQEAAQAATARMLAGFALAVLAIVAAVNAGLALIWRFALPSGIGYPTLFFETNTAVVLLLVLGGSWIESLRLREGGAHVARLAGGRPLPERPDALERRLANVVQEVAIAARLRAPAVWVLAREPSINAFAAGWTADDAVIAVTQGALERLERAELQGLVAHELGHIASGDTRLHTRLIGLVWGLQLVHGFGLAMAAPDERGRRSGSALVGLVFIVVGYAGWLAGRLLQAAVARQREFHADAAAVQYARTVEGIGGALRKIAGLAPQPAPRAPQSLAHLWASETGSVGALAWRRWLATHPPVAERLRRLYGRVVDTLPAPVLPPPDDEEPLLGFAAPPALRGADADAAPNLPRPARSPDAQPHSPDTQQARDAAARATHWRSPGECRAALLAWLIADDGTAAPWALWSGLAGSQPYVQALRTDWQDLPAEARWTVFDQAIARLRAGPAGDRLALVRAARALAPSGAARLRRTLLVQRLRSTAQAPGSLPLEALQPAFAAATALIGHTLGAPGATWARALHPGGAPARPRCALALRRLHAMQRPRVARAWADAALRTGLLDAAPAAAGMLVAACRLLDTPAPEL